MSFAKYLQFYKDNGLLAGSKIKCTVTDNTFIGQELVLSKGNEVLRSLTIPTSGYVEFFTDDSGELTLSSNSGTKVISGSVTIDAYSTYYVTLDSASSDNTRDVYADNTNVVIGLNETSKNVKLSYTGDLSNIAVVSSDHTTATATVNNNEVTITKASGNMEKECTVTATVQRTNTYQEKAININVKKMGTIGLWATASDETIANMIAQADAGQLDLADYWEIGDTRRVHLNSITQDGAWSAQPEQDVDLVLMHNPHNDNNYTLTTPTSGNRYQPSFIVGIKECLERPTTAGYSGEVTIGWLSSEHKITGYSEYDGTNMINVIEKMNTLLYNAFPTYIKNSLKAIDREFYDDTNVDFETTTGLYLYGTAYVQGSRKISQKICLPYLKELGLTSKASIYKYGTNMRTVDGSDKNNWDKGITSFIENKGTTLSYYANGGSKIKHKGISGVATDYFVSSLFVAAYQSSSSTRWFYLPCYAEIIDANGTVQLNDLSVNSGLSAQRGISPIMFI